jgi:acetylornithine deacetylase/succinyl-diaminopimelate desuccinylase-like protein
MENLRDYLNDVITYDTWLTLTSELVICGQPDSENPLDPDQPSGSEQAIATRVAKELREMGLEVELHAKQPGRPNVVATWRGSRPGPVLILNDHLDTYPAGDSEAWTMTGGNPYNPTVVDSRLFSRGTSDTRGNLACALLAVRALKAAAFEPTGTLKCIFTVDEEKHGPDGSIYLLDAVGVRGDFEITVEPTSWTENSEDWGIGVAVAHAGNCLLELKVEGTKSHLWRPDTGVNAIHRMSQLLTRLESMKFTHEEPLYPGGTPPMVCTTRIRAGEPREMQFTPSTCVAIIAIVGIVPGMTLQSILADIENEIDTAKTLDPTLQATVQQLPGSLFVNPTEEVAQECEPVASLCRAYEEILGRPPRLYRKNAYCDTIRFSERGIPAVTFGPGEDGWPPVNEYIHTPKAVPAARVLAIAISQILGPSKE